VLEGDCGHIATSCEADKARPVVAEALKQ